DRVLLAPVSDEEIEDASDVDTNQVDGVEGKAAVPASQPPIDQSSGEEPRMRRRDPDSNGDAPTERRRNREGSGRQRQNSQDAPE
ncbi:MAG TPA: hypothetical protein VJ063_20300, partial [Verrucomicrobiae bacterium]|nr:hypothetical protein [Verrucomicrobiae bacterium]